MGRASENSSDPSAPTTNVRVTNNLIYGLGSQHDLQGTPTYAIRIFEDAENLEIASNTIVALDERNGIYFQSDDRENFIADGSNPCGGVMEPGAMARNVRIVNNILPGNNEGAIDGNGEDKQGVCSLDDYVDAWQVEGNGIYGSFDFTRQNLYPTDGAGTPLNEFVQHLDDVGFQGVETTGAPNHYDYHLEAASAFGGKGADLSFCLEVQCRSADVSGDGLYSLADLDAFVQVLLSVDADGDGTPNYLDSDSDNDGILDSVESSSDGDSDGVPDHLDVFNGVGSGLPDAEWAHDFDGNGVLSEADLAALVMDDSLMNTFFGDLNFDLDVDFADFLVLSGNIGSVGGWADGNMDLDGMVAFSDFLKLSANFGFGT